MPSSARRSRAVLSALAVSPLLLAAGCARRPTTVIEDPGAKRQLLQVDGTTLRLEPTAAKGIEHDVPLPAERAWTLLPMAYEALGLPLSTVDSRQRLLAASNVRAQGRLGGTWVSRYVECGVSTSGLPNADSYVVLLDVQTQLVPSGDGARAGLSSAVRATARPSSTASNAPINCVSTGTLERRIAQVVREQDAKALR
jgi:hypothetical protein